MTAQLIDGKVIAEKIKNNLKKEVQDLQKKSGVTPGLAVVLVGDNPASQVYVRNKERASTQVGIHTTQHTLPGTITESDLLSLIAKLNADKAIHGILVQLPLPKTLNEAKILQAVAPEKDVDGFHPVNQGYLLAGLPGPRPCTPLGLIAMLDEIGYELKGQAAVIVGRSQIVGKPAALLFLERHATVTICHSRTKDLAGQVQRADVVVAAIGRPKMIAGHWIKPGAVVLDVGINRLEDGSLCGDVDFEAAKERASYITPVPGGVGPMTIAMLLKNTIEAAKGPK